MLTTSPPHESWILCLELRVVVESITPRNVLTQGTKVASGLNQIGQTVATLTQQITQAGYTPFSDDDAGLIVDTLTTFVEVHQALLNTIIGKHGILESTPFTAPIAFALRALESIVDSFAYALIGLIPTRADAAQAQLNALSVTFTRAIDTYS
ncbi:hypothetical protein GY45DRAFT_1320125 [Cubamyces sp. BRFM 1775]|nr:hypothetical protein GY45DRAFT_1320125 [Cubamyces sp. BRFM 1775]